MIITIHTRTSALRWSASPMLFEVRELVLVVGSLDT
jgi:hypothetical protein